MTDHVVIIGGGPGGYEAALVAAQLGAEVTVVDTDGIGGSAVLTDCVPSKTLIATAELMTDVARRQRARRDDRRGRRHAVDLARVNAAGQAAGRRPVRRHRGAGSRRRASGRAGPRPPGGPDRVVVDDRTDGEEILRADAVLVATGAAPRTLPTAAARRRADPDLGAGLRPRRGADRADRGRLRRHRRGVRVSAYLALGIPVTLVSSAATGCCPARTPTRPRCSRRCSTRRGMNVLSHVPDGVGDPRPATW